MPCVRACEQQTPSQRRRQDKIRKAASPYAVTPKGLRPQGKKEGVVLNEQTLHASAKEGERRRRAHLAAMVTRGKMCLHSVSFSRPRILMQKIQNNGIR